MGPSQNSLPSANTDLAAGQARFAGTAGGGLPYMDMIPFFTPQSMRSLAPHVCLHRRRARAVLVCACVCLCVLVCACACVGWKLALCHVCDGLPCPAADRGVSCHKRWRATQAVSS
jgi:hypothetical protein